MKQQNECPIRFTLINEICRHVHYLQWLKWTFWGRALWTKLLIRCKSNSAGGLPTFWLASLSQRSCFQSSIAVSNNNMEVFLYYLIFGSVQLVSFYYPRVLHLWSPHIKTWAEWLWRDLGIQLERKIPLSVVERQFLFTKSRLKFHNYCLRIVLRCLFIL
jgi:hypothetical protein